MWTSRATAPPGGSEFGARLFAARLTLSDRGSIFRRMTGEQAVIDALHRLPENASLDEIAEELQNMAAIRRGRADVVAGRTKIHQEAELLIESWASAWPSK